MTHNKVYDGTCHVLPMISFTEPAKHCYRAIASWCKFVTTRYPQTQDSLDMRDRKDDLRANTAISSILDTPSRSGNASPEPSRQSSVQANLKATSNDSTQLAPPIITALTAGAAADSSVEYIASPLDQSRANSIDTGHQPTNPVRPGFVSRTNTSGTLAESPIHSGYASQIDLTEEEDNASIPQSPSTVNGRTSSINVFEQGFPQDEIKVPKNIKPGYAGNYDIYTQGKVSPGPVLPQHRLMLIQVPRARCSVTT